MKISQNIEKGSITSPLGFKACGLRCGIKEKGLDLALIVSAQPAAAAAMFTTNRVKAAPVLLSQKLVQKGLAQALVINSGVANACTGDQGFADAREMTNLVASGLEIDAENVLVSSTGVIGAHLPMSKIREGIQKACTNLSPDGGYDAANAIMTTDTVPKHFSIKFEMQGTTYTIGAIGKGSGMINPNVATMISVFTTDLPIHHKLLQDALKDAVAESLNALTIDGEMSTNDSVFILANGAAGGNMLTEKNEHYFLFVDKLKECAIALARELAFDGEGATKLITVTVNGAASLPEAQKAAKKIANSMLFKTAIYGQDPNWGRVVSALGASGIHFEPTNVHIEFAGITVATKGAAISFDPEKMQKALQQKEITIGVDIAAGDFSATIFTCDLTHEYISINAEYHT